MPPQGRSWRAWRCERRPWLLLQAKEGNLGRLSEGLRGRKYLPRRKVRRLRVRLEAVLPHVLLVKEEGVALRGRLAPVVLKGQLFSAESALVVGGVGGSVSERSHRSATRQTDPEVYTQCQFVTTRGIKACQIRTHSFVGFDASDKLVPPFLRSKRLVAVLKRERQVVCYRHLFDEKRHVKGKDLAS